MKGKVLRSVVVAVVAVLTAVLPTSSTFAAMQTQVDCSNRAPTGSTMSMYSNNNIFFYNQCDDACAPGSYLGGPIAISGDTAEEKIWSGLTSFLTPEQAAGVLGNMLSESGLNPARHEGSAIRDYQPGFDLDANSNIAYGLGLIQWSFGRRIGLYNYVKTSNSSLIEYLDDYGSYSSGSSSSGAGFLQKAGGEVFDALASLELQYLKDELENHYSGIFNATTVYDAAKYFLEQVEKPRNPFIDSHPERVTQAEAFYNQFNGGGDSSSVSGTTDSDDSDNDSDSESGSGSSNASGASSKSYAGGCTTNLQGLADYVRAYVWPEYHGNSVEMMPAYREAVDARLVARSREGYRWQNYTGGINYPGVDCGGFVTIIMQNSGYEPEYNGCGSNTGPQEYWLREGGASERWEWLNPNGERMNAADLQLGDVAFTGRYPGGCTAGGQHTWMWIGEFSGFKTNVASASMDSRAPMSGTEGASWNSPRWYRKVR